MREYIRIIVYLYSYVSYKETTTMTDELIIKHLLDNTSKSNERAFKWIYENYYQMILHFVTNNSGTKDDVKDVFQDALISLYNNVKRGSYRPESKLSTYFFSICKNNWFKKLRKSGRMTSLENKGYEHLKSDDNVETRIEYTEQQKLIGRLLHTIGTECGKLLKLFYFEKMRMIKIAAEMDYSSEQVAKNQKSKCMKKLRAVVMSSDDIQYQLRNSI